MPAALSHSKSRLVTLDELRGAPDPQPVPGSRYHRPVRHDVLVDALISYVQFAGWTIDRTELAVTGANDAKLFGTMDIHYGDASVGAPVGRAIGFRHGNDQSMSLGAVAGVRVFVCDNMCLSGDMVVLRKKHTTGTNVNIEVEEAIARVTRKFANLDNVLHRMGDTALVDTDAENVLYDMFVRQQVLALSHLADVHRWYFDAPRTEAPESVTDVAPRSVWGLYNACTRTIREFAPHRRLSATMNVTNYLTDRFSLN